VKRKSVPNKTRALLQKEVGSRCPFCGNGDVDHFHPHHIDGDPGNDDFLNLILLCPLCHSKITKGDISEDIVRLTKNRLQNKTEEFVSMSAKVINFHSKIQNAVVGDHNKVTIIKQTKKSKYPEGCIGFDIARANYIGYLIDRYHKYKEYEVGKEGMNYAIFPSDLKSKFRIGRTRTIYHVPISRFEELALYIQYRINGTVLAKVNKGKGRNRNYELFEEYVTENT
jgi:hypothetical protein